MLVRIQGFDGFIPREGDFLLPDNAAQVADNVKLYAGELRSWRKPVPASPTPILVENPKKIHLLVNPATFESSWLSWATEVDVADAVTADQEGRLYYTGDGSPKKTNYALAVQGLGPYPFDYLEMGVPAPLTAPTLASAGGATPQTRVYVYTYISQFGALEEESAPSPAATVTSNATGATVTVSGLGTAGPAGKYNITKKRIYRTVGGNTTGDFRLVAEIPITQASYTDTLNDAQLPLDILQSLEYTTPPATLKGLVRMSGGFLAAFQNNEVWFSEPFAPHAWPVKYVLTTRAPIVGLCAVGALLVVMTTESPEIIFGQSPDSLSQEIIPLIEPCVSKRSIATDGDAAIYASPNGLVAIGAGVRKRFTDALFRRDEWQEYNPSSMYGVVYDGTYFGFYDAGTGRTGALLINSTDRPALSRVDFVASAATVTRGDARLFYFDQAVKVLYQFDADPDDNQVFTWRSKKFRLPMPTNMNAMQVFADYAFLNSVTYDPTADLAFNSNLIATDNVGGAINSNYVGQYLVNGNALVTIPTDANDLRYVGVQLYGDGELFFSTRVSSDGTIKLPSGFRYSVLELQLSGNVPVYSISLANSVFELKGAQ